MIIDLYSRRQSQVAGETPDVYSYDAFPDTLRIQVQQIFRDALGPHLLRSGYSGDYYIRDNADVWKFIAKSLRKEFGVHRLTVGSTEGEEVLNYLLTAEATKFLDTVEMCIRVLHRMGRKWSDNDRTSLGVEQSADEAIEEINVRFRQANVGFQFVDGNVVRLDSEYTHEEIVKPALSLLRKPEFAGPQEEFLRAHKHYRSGEYPQAITEAAKAFESVLKAVCDIKGWPYSKGSRASDLIKLVRAKRLWPDYLDASFDQLLATLSSGLPAVRNKDGAHGQGSIPRRTPSYVAAYALNLAATKIVFVGDAAFENTEENA